MLKVLKLLVVGLCLGCSLSAIASTHYHCVVKEVHSLNDKGVLERDNQLSIMKGKLFSVDTNTGLIKSDNNLLRNDNGVYGQPKVIDKGSNEQSFKVLTIYQPYASLEYLEIMVFENTQEKPFQFLARTGIYSGTCKI